MLDQPLIVELNRFHKIHLFALRRPPLKFVVRHTVFAVVGAQRQCLVFDISSAK